MGSRFCGNVVLAVVATSLLVAACGSGSAASSAAPELSAKSPRYAHGTTASVIVPQVRAALRAAKSFHVTGTAVYESRTLSVDMSFYGTSGLYGSIGGGSGIYWILVVNGRTYLKVNSAYLKTTKAPPSACASSCGKYVEIGGAAARQLTGAFSMKAFIGALTESLGVFAGDGGAFFVPVTYHGQRVLSYYEGVATLDVAEAGPAYPVLESGLSSGSLTYSEWNSVPAPTVPPASKVISLGQLAG